MSENRPMRTGQAILPPITDPTVHAEIDRLARRYLDAGGIGMDLLQAIGGNAETLIEYVPAGVRKRVDRITYRGLNRAFDAAASSRRVLRDRGAMFNRLLSTVSGAAGGIAGLGGAVLELPVTITLLLRAILEVGAEHGFDPDTDEVRIEALRVLASAGPLSEDDATDLGLLAARLSITGHSVQGLIAKVAPKLSISFAQKLGAQAVPILGAVAGASINYTFARYYQELARVNFGLLRLEHETGLPREALVEAFEIRVNQLRAPVSRKRR
ncbi:EcsC family protein [Paracoccus sp. DMF-8]|uniref:EcsC family protein n=1 Tax=Paracoccus sp. DMF-8 TaxID=3019445 RepID=UPI0023E3C58F|nr:EcsC family protein [Paracoccus sp. DMF-8]MDF3608489.1 EcsC family protein [Paracoccus sp. DMF-8]